MATDSQETANVTQMIVRSPFAENPTAKQVTQNTTRERDESLGYSVVSPSRQRPRPELHADTSKPKCSLCSSVFWCNKFNMFRFCMFVVIAFFMFVSCLYAYGQFYSLALGGYYCPPKTKDEIEQHSIANNLNHGDDTQCWSTSSYKLDEEKVFASTRRSLDGYTAQQVDVDVGLVIKVMIFLMPALFLLYTLIYFAVVLLRDCRRFYRNTWHTVTLRLQSNAFTMSRWHDVRCIGPAVAVFRRLLHGYAKYFGIDKVGWVLLAMSREAFEIGIQSVALLRYGGYGNSPHATDVLLAEDERWVITFAVFLSLNCMSTAILWWSYLFKHSTVYGSYFFSLLTIIDSVFDTFYAVFPLLILGRTDGDWRARFRTAAASINDSSTFLLLAATYIPLIFLSAKLYMVAAFLSRSAYSDWVQFYILQQHKTVKTLHTAGRSSTVDAIATAVTARYRQSTIGSRHRQATIEEEVQSETDRERDDGDADDGDADDGDADRVDDNCNIEAQLQEQTTSCKCNVLCYGSEYLEEPSQPSTKKVYILRKVFLFCWSLGLFLFGLSVMIAAPVHFKRASALCDEYAANGDLHKHPEMVLWQYCNFKVYPFFDTDLPCNCRSFAMRQNETLSQQAVLRDFYPNAVNSIFSHFYMLESMMIKCNDDSDDRCKLIYSVDLQSYPPKSARLRALRLDALMDFIFLNDGDIWKNLEVFFIDANEKQSPWFLQEISYDANATTDDYYMQIDAEHLSHWRKVQHFYVKAANFTDIEFLCNMQKLKVIKIQTSFVGNMPKCMDSLSALEIIDFSYSVVTGIDVAIFSKQNLKQVTLTMTSLTADDFGLDAFGWNNATKFRFAFSIFCSLYYEREYGWNPFPNNPAAVNLPEYDDLFDFLSSNDSCVSDCFPDYLSFPHPQLSDAIWKFFTCDVDNIGDGICDFGCQNLFCGYDDGDCSQLCESQSQHECNQSLLLNNQCDLACNISECDYDSQICLRDTTGVEQTTCAVTKCDVSWINDGECDEFCRQQDACDFDGTDCECLENSFCHEQWKTWQYFIYVASSEDSYIDFDEMCFLFPGLAHLLPADLQSNCTAFFNEMDKNGDDLVTAYETSLFYALPSFGLDEQTTSKVMQWNCSSCAPNMTVYYGPNYAQTVAGIKQSLNITN